MPATVRRLLVLGGSFDPPHHGHIQLPLVVRQHLERAVPALASIHLLLVPAARSPHKPFAPRAPDEHRLAMLTLATEHLPRVSIWTDELNRAAYGNASTSANTPSPSYTIDTLTRLSQWLHSPAAPAHASDLQITLLIGADQALAFHLWHRAAELLRRFTPVVMLRALQPAHPTHHAHPTQPTSSQALLAGIAIARSPEGSSAWNADDLALWSRTIVPTGRLDVSSTSVRAALAADDQHTLARALDPLVLAYIRKYRLYQA